MFKYGMRLRPFYIGCQPMNGLIDSEKGNVIMPSWRRYKYEDLEIK